MTTRIAYTRPDGGVSIVTVAEGKPVDRVLARLPADAADIRQLPGDWQPPADRAFRNAWKMDGDKIDIDMERARDIHRDRLRRMRAPKLAELDIEYQRADEAGDNEKKKDIAKRKQALRDVTADPAIELASTPDELRAAIPAAIKE